MDWQMTERLRIGLAAVPNEPTVEGRLETLRRVLEEAKGKQVAIVCFPEAYIPGLRGMDVPVPPPDQRRQEAALEFVQAAAQSTGVAVIVGMEWETASGLHNAAFVVEASGDVAGYQVKNQIPPVESPYYVPEGSRKLFEIDGVPFGITICHEGWRYPESVRWSAVRGARVIFHPQVTGSDLQGPSLMSWGDPDGPYYEKAMIARAVENDVFFASVNNALRYQESATSLIGPDGSCLAHVPYGEEALLVCDLDITQATGAHASRFNPEFYPAN
jgi:predicted amidohydrolase